MAGLSLAAILAVFVGAGGWAWRRAPAARELPAALPTRPDLRGQPALFAERLADAEAQAKSRDGVLAAAEELGRLYHANGYNPEAEACWEWLSARQPGEPRWWYYRAVLRLADNDYERGTELLRSTLARAPSYAPAFLHLANLQLKTGELDAAERNYRARLQLLPRDPYARLGLVRVALQKERRDEARLLLERLLKDAPNFASAHSLYAELLAAWGDEAGAGWHRWLGVETIRYTEPEDAWIDELQAWCYDYDRLCVLGSIESLRDHRDRAKTLFQRAIELEPGTFDAYQLLSAQYLQQKMPDRARDLLEAAKPRLAVPLSTAWFTQVCQAYRRLQQPVDAENAARAGLAQQTDSPELLEALALALADQERHAEAVGLYEAALGRNPNDASINYNHAVSLLALRRLDEALAALDRSLALQPTFPPTLLLRGRIELAAGHLPEAERYLRPLFESHPEDGEARGLLAEWHHQMAADAEKRGDRPTAARHYADGLVLAPDDPELQLKAGLLCLAQRNFSQAIEHLEKQQRLRPNYAPGCLVLGQAYAASGRREDARVVLRHGVEMADRSGSERIAAACRQALQGL